MTTHSPQSSDDALCCDELSELRRAMCRAGAIMPTTAGAFGTFKVSVDAQGVAIPTELQAMKGPDPNRRFASQSIDEAIPVPLPPAAERLAQAARESKEITDDVRKRMTCPPERPQTRWTTTAQCSPL